MNYKWIVFSIMILSCGYADGQGLLKKLKNRVEQTAGSAAGRKIDDAVNKEIVKELIQENFNTKNIRLELQKILTPEHRVTLLKQYDLLEKKLGGDGASEKTASLIIKHLT